VRRTLATTIAILGLAIPRVASAEETAPPPASTSKTADAHLHYTLEGIELRGNARTSARVIRRYVHLREGDVLDVNDPEITLTRYRLLGTGFFSSVELSLRRGSKRGNALLVIEVTERNTLIIQDLWLGIAGDEDRSGHEKPLSAFVGLSAAETNLAGAGITLGAGFGVAADQLALRLFFEDPAIAGSGWSINLRTLYNDARDFFGNRAVAVESALPEQRDIPDHAVVATRRIGATLGTGHDLTVSSQFSLDYHLEAIRAQVPIVASHLRGNTREPIDFAIRPGNSVLSSIRAALTYDTRDGPILPTRGSFASATQTAGLMPLGSDYSFARIELSGRHWFRLPWQHVLQTSVFLGAIAGDAPFFEKFYVGDFTDLLPDRILGLAPDRQKPPNLLGTDIVEVRFGDLAARIEAEYRIPIYTGRRAIYGIDIFGAGGAYAVASRRDVTDPPSGYAGLARVPIDLTYNFGFRIDTNIGGATVAFSNLLGLAPIRGARR